MLTQRQWLNYWNYLKYLSKCFVSPMTDEQVAAFYEFLMKDSTFLQQEFQEYKNLIGVAIENKEECRVVNILGHFPILNSMLMSNPLKAVDKDTIMIFYILQWPVNEKLKEEMDKIKKGNEFELDNEQKIVKFISEASDCNICLQREANFNNTDPINPLPWSISELNLVLAHFCRLLSNYTKFESDLSHIYKEISEKTKQPKRSAKQLKHKIHQYVSIDPKGTSEDTYQQQLVTLYQLGLPVPVICFKEYFKNSIYQLDPESKLIFCSRAEFEIGTRAENVPLNNNPLQELSFSVTNTLKRTHGQSEEHQELEGTAKRRKDEGGKQAHLSFTNALETSSEKPAEMSQLHSDSQIFCNKIDIIDVISEKVEKWRLVEFIELIESSVNKLENIENELMSISDLASSLESSLESTKRKILKNEATPEVLPVIEIMKVFIAIVERIKANFEMDPNLKRLNEKLTREIQEISDSAIEMCHALEVMETLLDKICYCC